MNVRVSCPKCHRFFVTIDPSKVYLEPFRCVCGRETSLQNGDWIKNPTEWNGCPVCDCPEAFLCKVIPRKTLFVLLVPILLVAFWALSRNWWIGLAILFAVTLLDALLYGILPSMWVCYGCQSEFRGLTQPQMRTHKPFDHHTAERYRLRKFLLKP